MTVRSGLPVSFNISHWILDHIKMWVWYNNSWLGFDFSKNSELCTKRKKKQGGEKREKYTAKNEPSFVTVKCCDGS